MAHLKQGLKIKYARTKNKKAKYKVATTKYTYIKKTPTETTKKYKYSRKIMVNGKTRYYYA